MKYALALCGVIVLGASTRLAAQQQIVNDAAAAMGGRDRILAEKTLVIEGEGTNGNLGQDMTPDATSQAFLVSGYTRAIDIATGRVRIEQTRTPNFTYFQGQAPQKQVLGIDGDVGYNVAPNGAATRIADAAMRDRRVEMYHHPLTIVRAALDPAAKLSNPRAAGGRSLVDIALANGVRVTLAVDTATKLPASVTSMTDNTVLGDVAIETTFADYQDVNGLKLPARLTTKTDKFVTTDLRLSKQTIDGDAGDLAAPSAAASAAPITGAPPVTVTVEEVAPGIWFLAGQSHHSVLVEFADHLTLIEAPQSDDRALAVIAKARALRPGKPLTQLVMTHHHFDHSGGVRAAISEGLTVVTHQGNAAFVQDIARRPHTIVPDALSKNPKAVTVVPVGDQLTLQDSSMTLNLYPIVGSGHTDTMLMAYFQKERVLVEADVFSPASAIQPYAANLQENIVKHKLQIDRIVPIHGTVVPYSALTQAVAGKK